MEWISANASWIRDIFTPVFTAILVAVAILTYLRAKETILQPLRSEVVRRQAQKMTELMDFVSSTQESDPIDYYGLCSLNIFIWMDEYGFVFRGDTEIKKRIRDSFDGYILLGTPDTVVHTFKLPEAIFTTSDDTSDDELKEYRRQRYQKAKSGEFDTSDIDKIFLTKQCYEYRKRLSALLNDPLLPSKILDVLHDFDRSIYHNLINALRSSIADFIVEFITKSSESTTPLRIDPDGVFNIFNRRRNNHSDILNNLRNNIREHLKVESIP